MRQILPLLFAFLVIWLTSRRAGAKNRPPVRPPRETSPEEEERTRRVQAEVRRKIQERRAYSGLPPVAEPAPAKKPQLAKKPEPEEETEPPSDEQAAAVLAAQRRLEDQIRTLERDEADTGRARRPAAPIGLSPPVAPAPVFAHADDLRRAIIWREILGPPVSLRGPLQ